MKTTIKLFLTASVGASLFFSSCKDNSTPVQNIASQFINLEDEVMGFQTRIKGDAYSGVYYSHVDSTNAFSLGYSFYLPDSVKNTNIKVYVNAFIRCGEQNTPGTIAVTLNKADSMIVWKEIYLGNHVTVPNQWTIVTDSILLPKEITNISPLKLNVFGFYPKGKTFLDIDDMSITVKSEK
ncbi:MAG: hypothetical protein ACJ76F_14510 [Bacteroidia bacterium]